MLYWFLVAGNEPEKLKTEFIGFFSRRYSPRGIALWKWKRTCWICSPEKFKQDVLTTFADYGIIEFSSAPSPADIQFIHGDDKALNSLS